MKKQYKRIINNAVAKIRFLVMRSIGFVVVGAGILTGCASAGAGQEVKDREDITVQESYTDMQDVVSKGADGEDHTEARTETMEFQDEGTVPDIVLQKAEEIVEGQYMDGWQTVDTYVDWRIESLTYSYTYEDFEGMILQIYQLNYQFLSEKPEEVQLLGGMSIDEEGWVVTGYPDSDFLVFQQNGDTLTYLSHMFENDCYPGDETFTSDLQRIYDMGQLFPKDGQMEDDTKELAIFQEGDMEVQTATRTFGEGYSIYLTDGDWEQTGANEWTALLNENVQLTIEHFEDKTTGQLEQELMGDGYIFEEKELVKREGNMVYKVRLNNAAWQISYCFPEEAGEGWGMALPVIADTFYWEK